MMNKLRNKIEGLKIAVGIVMAAIRIRKTSKDFGEYVLNLKNIDTLNIQGNEVNIKADNDAVKVTGFKFAIAHAIPVNGALVYNIVLEENIDNLGINDFLVNHEIGHFVNEVFNKGTMLNSKRTLENECDADLYAAQQIGFDRAINALQILSQSENIDNIEIMNRINYLRVCKIMMGK